MEVEFDGEGPTNLQQFKEQVRQVHYQRRDLLSGLSPHDSRNLSALENTIDKLLGIRRTDQSPQELQEELRNRTMQVEHLLRPTETGVNRQAVNDKVNRINELASGWTTDEQKQEILDILQGASQPPEEMQALLDSLKAKGWDYLDLFNELGTTRRAGTTSQDFVSLTAPAMSVRQKAEAIKQFVEGVTTSSQEQAIAELLKSEEDPSALLGALQSRGISLQQLMDEVELPNETKVALARNENTSQDVLTQFALAIQENEQDRDVAVALANNSRTPSDALAHLAATQRDREGLESVFEGIVHHPNTPPDVIDRIANSDTWRSASSGHVFDYIKNEARRRAGGG